MNDTDIFPMEHAAPALPCEYMQPIKDGEYICDSTGELCPIILNHQLCPARLKKYQTDVAGTKVSALTLGE